MQRSSVRSVLDCSPKGSTKIDGAATPLLPALVLANSLYTLFYGAVSTLCHDLPLLPNDGSCAIIVRTLCTIFGWTGQSSPAEWRASNGDKD